MRKTLLHFITGCVTDHEARRFWRAFGNSEEEAEKFLQKVQKHYEQGNPVAETFKEITRKLFGLEKTPLDLTPEEIERLSNVVRDRTDEKVLEIQMVPELFNAPVPDPQEIEYKVADFYVKNKNRFDSSKDIDYDKESNTLNIKIKKRFLENLLRSLEVKDEFIKKINSDSYSDVPGLKQADKTYRIAMTDITDLEKGYNAGDLKKLVQVMNNNLSKQGATVSIDDIATPKDSTLVFRGDLDVLEAILHKAFREKQNNSSAFFPLQFDNSARIDQVIKRLRDQNG